MDNLENLVNLTDEQLDAVAGAGSTDYPEWLNLLDAIFGSEIRKLYDKYGCGAVKNICIVNLGEKNSHCQVIPC